MLEKASGCSPRASTRRRSRCSSRSGARIRTTSTRRCGWRRRTPCSAHDAQAVGAVQRRRRSRPSRPTSAPTSRCTTRGRRTGSAPCRCSSRWSPRCRIACRRSRRWPWSAREQGDVDGGDPLRQKIYALRTPTAGGALRLGELAMEAGADGARDAAFEGARALQGAGFTHDLELGVLYLAARRFAEARDRARPRAADPPRLPDGALQARPGERAAAGARRPRADRGAPESGADADDAPADRAREAVSTA